MRPDHLETVAEPDLSALPPNVYSSACPSRRLLALLSDKWSLLILPLLKHGPMRNAELLRGVDGVSQKMLTQTLRHLERCGLIIRHDFGEVPPRVEYALSPLGDSLASVFAEIDHWVHAHFKQVQAAQDAFDRREGQREEAV